MSGIEDETVSFVPEQKVREIVLRRFAELKSTLEPLVEGAEIHHVGSTAIPGSLTKGDLDIQVRVSERQFAQVRARLKALYAVNEGGFIAADAISFEDYSSDTPVGIHLTVVGGSCDLQFKFRDRLLASASLRKEYDDLKRRFEGGSMQAYRNAKEGFVLRVLPEYDE